MHTPTGIHQRQHKIKNTMFNQTQEYNKLTKCTNADKAQQLSNPVGIFWKLLKMIMDVNLIIYFAEYINNKVK